MFLWGFKQKKNRRNNDTKAKELKGKKGRKKRIWTDSSNDISGFAMKRIENHFPFHNKWSLKATNSWGGKTEFIRAITNTIIELPPLSCAHRRIFFNHAFLDATSYLYLRLCPSFRRLVGLFCSRSEMHSSETCKTRSRWLGMIGKQMNTDIVLHGDLQSLQSPKSSVPSLKKMNASLFRLELVHLNFYFFFSKQRGEWTRGRYANP